MTIIFLIEFELPLLTFQSVTRTVRDLPWYGEYPCTYCCLIYHFSTGSLSISWTSKRCAIAAICKGILKQILLIDVEDQVNGHKLDLKRHLRQHQN